MPFGPSLVESRISRARTEDLGAIAELHARAFPTSALTAFGGKTLERYYRWLSEGPHEAAVMVAWHGERLVGFCAAGFFRGAMRGFLRANRRYLALHVLRHPSLLATELVRERIALAGRLMLRWSPLGRVVSPAAAAAPQDVRRFGVLAIATDPAVRGTGAGRALMLEAEARARAEHYTSMSLTVHPSNTRGVKFYEELGWVRDEPWTGHMAKVL